MLWTKLFIPTLREEPSDGGAAQRRLIRAGYVRDSGLLFLGKRSVDKIGAMVRADMKQMGAQEFSLQAPFFKTVANIARHDVRSYKQLPQVWFQFDGALHQSCSLDFECAANDRAYFPHFQAYQRILDRCGLKYIQVRDELAIASPDGDQFYTAGSTYESNLQHARSVPRTPVIPDPEGDLSPEEFHTPGHHTIADICGFTRLPETSQMKSLVMVADGEPLLVLLRGDHTLNELKLVAQLGISEIRQAAPPEIREWFGADPGSLGPIGIANIRIVADESLRGRRNMLCGANRNDYHLRHVTPGEDFQVEFFDLRFSVTGDTSRYDSGPLTVERGFSIVEIDDHFDTDLHVSNESGKEVALDLSHYRLLLDRVLLAAAEQQYDQDGLALTPAIAPFGVVITPVNLKDPAQDQAARTLHDQLAAFDPLLDDRDERPGVKFKDADLIGVPFRVTVGKKLAQGLVEVVNRRTRESQDVAVNQVAAFLSEKL